LRSRRRTVRTVAVLTWLITVAAVDRAAGPDADDVALEDAALELRERDLGPLFRPHGRFQEILRKIMRQPAAFDVGAENEADDDQSGEAGSKVHGGTAQKTSCTAAPVSTILIGRPTLLIYSRRGLTRSAWQNVQNRSGTLTGRSTTSIPLA